MQNIATPAAAADKITSYHVLQELRSDMSDGELLAALQAQIAELPTSFWANEEPQEALRYTELLWGLLRLLWWHKVRVVPVTYRQDAEQPHCHGESYFLGDDGRVYVLDPKGYPYEVRRLDRGEICFLQVRLAELAGG